VAETFAALQRRLHSLEAREPESEDEARADEIESIFMDACALMLQREGDLLGARQQLAVAQARAEGARSVERQAVELEEECVRLAAEVDEVRAMVRQLRNRLDGARSARRRFGRDPESG
jgi:hypothetical protein